MADGSGIDSTGLELLLEFDGDYTDSSGNGRDQSSYLGAETYVSDGAIPSTQGAQFAFQHRNFIDTGVTGWSTADLFAGAANPWTMATWLRFEGPTANGTGTICARQKGTGSVGLANSIFFLHIDTTGVLFIRLRGSETTYELDLRDGEWHALVVTWDGTDAAFYLDNVAQTAPTVGSLSNDSTNHLFIAAADLQLPLSKPWSSNLNGQLDDFRLYSRAWSVSEVNLYWLYGQPEADDSSGIQPANLELHLKFEGDLTDSSPNGRDQDSNLQNGPMSYTSGIIDTQASDWDADSDQYINTGVTSMGDFTFNAVGTDAWAISVWVKHDGVAGGLGTVLARTFGGGNNTRLRVQNTQIEVSLRGNTTTFSSLPSDPNDGNWHHIVLTWNGSTATLYFDGSSQGTATVGGTSPDGNILIGAYLLAGVPDVEFDVYMDDLRLYGRNLSSTDVTDLTNNSPSKFDTTLTLTSFSGNKATVTVTFEEAIDNSTFVLGDITVTNGTASNLTMVSSTVYTFDVTPTAAGTVTALIAADKVQTSAGLDNKASNTLAWGTGSSAFGLSSFDRTEDDSSRTASILIGPIPISEHAGVKSKLRRAVVLLGRNTDATGTVDFYAGADAQDAVDRAEDDAAQTSIAITTLTSNNGVCFPQVSGHGLVIGIDVTGDHLTFEQSTLELTPGGRNRMGRYS